MSTEQYRRLPPSLPEPSAEIKDAARHVFEYYFEKKWTWKEEQQIDEKAWNNTVKQVNRLERKFPDIFTETVQKRGPDEARSYLEHFATKTWAKGRERNDYFRTIKDINRIKKLYPEVWQEHLTTIRSTIGILVFLDEGSDDPAISDDPTIVEE